jgi:signal transduction histidine kinase
LINSIKYAKRQREAFRIQVEVEEDWDKFIVKFQDWGMGIATGFDEKIFEEGFRTAEAIGRDVAGSGLGLTIARQIMRSLSGDLILYRNAEPTEFHMVIPKSLLQPRGEQS